MASPRDNDGVDSEAWGSELQVATASEQAEVENAEAKGDCRCFYIKRAGYNDIVVRFYMLSLPLPLAPAHAMSKLLQASTSLCY